MRTTPLRRRLLLLTAVALLPLAFMSGIALKALLAQQSLQTEQAALNLTRALATAVDTELRLTVSALQALALAEPIGAGNRTDLVHAHEMAVKVLAARPEWRAVLLASPSGEVMFSTASRFGTALPRVAESSSLGRLVATGDPVIGYLAKGPQGNLGVPVRVPVMRDGEVRYVLTAVIRPEAILNVISRQRVPDDWTVSVFDAKSQRVARSREHERYLGARPSASLQAVIDEMAERQTAFGRSATLEGSDVHTALARVGTTGWMVALGVPTTVTQQPVRNSAIAYGGGLLLSLLLGGWAAWLVSRSIGRPIGRLRDAATALGRGEPVAAAQSQVTEIEAVSDALVAAATLRMQGEAERQLLLDGERSARAAAEQAQQRMQLLANAGALLSTTLEEETTLSAIASVIVPGLADACVIDLLDDRGQLQRKLTYHADAQRADAIARFLDSAEGRAAGTRGTAPWVVAQGKPFLDNLDPAAELQADSEGRHDAPTFLQQAQGVGLRAAFTVPLVARGRTIGTLGALQADSGRQLGAEDATLIGELAQRAALALDNARLLNDVQAALRQAQLAGRAKDEFLAMLGHELRNPLAPIVSSLELMARRHRHADRANGASPPEDGDGDAAQRHIIERQVKHLSRMVNDLLDVSRIASGKVDLHRERIDLRDTIARALELTQPALQARAQPPEVRMPGDPVPVHGDALRLTQIVCNLLHNAVKFSAPDQAICITLRRVGDAAQVSVEDKGIGIPAALLPQVFDSFVQGEQALQRASGGLGLGLAIARNLSELHGGTLTAHSDGPGMGSCFTVTLPVASDTPLPAPLAHAAVATPTRPARLLVVDDNEDAAQALSILLTLEGHEVRTARSAEEALEVVQGPDAFLAQAALLDIGLPGMDGYQLAARLRGEARTCGMRLIALTGYGREPDQRRAAEAGFDAHLIKPVEIDVLLHCLNPLLADAGLQTAAAGAPGDEGVLMQRR